MSFPGSKNNNKHQASSQFSRSSLVSLLLALVSSAALFVAASSANRTSSRLSSGSLAAEHQWPFYAWLQNAQQACGAIVLGRYILTAASCVRHVEPETLQVSVGTNDRNSNVHLHAVRNICASSLFRPSADGKRYEDDFAMLFLDKPPKLDGQTIDEVKITREADPNTDWFTHDQVECYVIGAGFTAGTDVLGDKLMQSPAKVRNCPERQTKGSESTVCYRILGPIAGVACEGDSGGPLVCKRDDNFELVGIVSHTSKPCEPYEARLGLMEAAKFQRFVNTTFYDCIEWFESLAEQQAVGERQSEPAASSRTPKNWSFSFGSDQLLPPPAMISSVITTVITTDTTDTVEEPATVDR